MTAARPRPHLRPGCRQAQPHRPPQNRQWRSPFISATVVLEPYMSTNAVLEPYMSANAVLEECSRSDTKHQTRDTWIRPNQPPPDMPCMLSRPYHAFGFVAAGSSALVSTSASTGMNDRSMLLVHELNDRSMLLAHELNDRSMLLVHELNAVSAFACGARVGRCKCCPVTQGVE